MRFTAKADPGTWDALSSWNRMPGRTSGDPVPRFGLLYKRKVSANWSGSQRRLGAGACDASEQKWKETGLLEMEKELDGDLTAHATT